MSTNGTQRREQILAELVQHRHASARDLAMAVQASEATVRRDLKALAETGRVELVYGGATIRRVSDFSFQSKATRHIEAKRVIGSLAAELISDDEQLFLDSGTTSFA